MCVPLCTYEHDSHFFQQIILTFIFVVKLEQNSLLLSIDHCVINSSIHTPTYTNTLFSFLAKHSNFVLNHVLYLILRDNNDYGFIQVTII